MLFFIKIFTLIALSFQFANAALENEKISIEISAGKIKTTTFAITCNNPNIAQEIQKKLEHTRRFKKINCDISIKSMQTAGVDLFIKLSLIEGIIYGEIHDVMQKKKIEEFEIKLTPQNDKAFNKIANHIYQAWIAEPGIFDTSIIASADIDLNLSTLMKINYSNPNLKRISPPIAYLSTIISAGNNILITKFCTKNRGFAIFSYDTEKKDFHRILSIKNGSVFSPIYHNNQLYFSAANENTTAIYYINQPKEYVKYNNFNNFESSAYVKQLTKIPNRIATSINVHNNIAIFCSNKNGKSAIFSMNLQKKERPRQISAPENAYYDPALFSNQKVAAIKTSEGKFHLILIDLGKAESSEKILISKYYLSKPCWSPCGNWIAVSGREKDEKDQIILIHKSGKYMHTIFSNEPLKNPVWINN